MPPAQRRSPEALLGTLQELVDRLVTTPDEEVLVERVVTFLVQALGADRGLVLLTDAAGATTTVEARGPAGPLSARQRAEISRTVVHEVWRTGKAMLLEAQVGATSASVQALGIACALAAPLRIPGRGDRRGVVYVDYRDVDTDVGEPERQTFELAVDLLSLVMTHRRRLDASEEELRAALGREPVLPPTLDELLRPRSMAPLRAEIEAAVASELPLLLLGESGTGKTLLARAIAAASLRLPVVRAMLGAADDLNTITSELFGHERGSFSGAIAARTGLVAFAAGGTLVLDEILNLPPHAQQLLLDFTQFGTYRPLGWSEPEPRRSAVRLIAATNGDLAAAVASGAFREDLLFRLGGITVTLPPLRERREEIPELAEAVLRRLDPGRGWTLGVEARRALLAPHLPWSGNLRQLELAVRRARDRALTADRDATRIDAVHLDPASAPERRSASPAELGDAWRALVAERERCDEVERALIRRALDKHHGVVARAAGELGLGRSSFLSRMRTLGLEPP